MYEKAKSFWPDPRRVHPGIARVYALTGRRQEARQMISNVKKGWPLESAAVYASLGEMDEAIRVLERAIEARDSLLNFIKTEPSLENLQSHPRWKELLRRMKFPEE